MDQLVQCPVCTLFLHNGMSLESHLDTHPKDQVIKALCSIANKNSSCGSSRTSTPANSERSYRSRSRTPSHAGDEGARWSGSQRAADQERYWARTPSGSSSRAPSRNRSRTPRSSSSATFSRMCTPDIRMVDNMTYDATPVSGSPQPSSHSNSNFTSPPLALKADKMQQTYPPPMAEYEHKYLYPEQQEEREVKYSRSADYTPIDVNNVFSYNVPTVAGATGKLQPDIPIPTVGRKRTEPVKILPKSSNLLNLVKNNMGAVQYLAPGKPMHVVVGSSTPTFVQKNVQNSMIMTGPLPCSQGHRDSKAAPPLVQNPFNQMSSGTFTPGTTVVTQNSQYFYQEMVQNIDPKSFMPSVPAVFAGQENVTNVAQTSSVYQNVMLVDQFGNASCMYGAPPDKPAHAFDPGAIVANPHKPADHNKTLVIEVTPILPPAPLAGKVLARPPRHVSAIVSNFTLPKAEAPNVTITEKVEPAGEAGGGARGLKILSNIKVEVPVQHSKSMINTVMDLTGGGERSRPASPAPPAEPQPGPSRAPAASPAPLDPKVDMEFSDSCPVPDLICNEKPSVSPVSELSESGDGCPERAPEPKEEPAAGPPPARPCKTNPLRLNNIFVKKTKKVLQIKNLKPIPESGPSARDEAAPAAAPAGAFSQVAREQHASTLKTISIEELPKEEVAGFERAAASPPLVKEEPSSSSEASAPRAASPASPASPAERGLLELEAASKSERLASMMSDNYFGDNLYEHYFTAERGEGYEARAAPWGEPSREPEFVLPTFVHESYKIAAGDYDAERDCKRALLDAAPPLDICADERMPPHGDLSRPAADDDDHWTAAYAEAPPAEPYDLMARESWLSDGSELDATEKRDNLEELAVFGVSRAYSCAECGAVLASLKELRAHAARAHPALPAREPAPAPGSSTDPPPDIVKKEEKDDNAGAGAAGEGEAEAEGEAMLRVYGSLGAPALELRGLLAPAKRRRKDFVCPTCKEDQGSEAGFAAHLRVHPLECLKCGKCFMRRANLTLHLKTHAGIKNYKCEVCEKRFLTRQKLQEHHNIHTGRAPVKCTLCDETFRRYSNMVQHRNRHHLKKRAAVRDYVCSCGLVVHSRAKLAWHRETHEPRPKACMHCPDKFVHAASLTRHIRRKHDAAYVAGGAGAGGSKAADNVPCPVCKRPYLRGNLRAHVATHAGARPWQCHVCNKAFSTKWNLKLHRWTHAARSAKPFQCALCPAAFVRRAELAAHAHAHRAVRPYTCNYCGCQFIRKYNCQRHVREHEQAKRFVCAVPECGKAFHRSYYLREHMKVHSGARPFACAVCGKTSSNKSNHNKHLKIHHARDAVATET